MLLFSVYQALLSGFQSIHRTPTSAAGTAIIQLHERGSLSYNIKVTGLDSKITRIRLEGASNKKGKRKVVANFHKSFTEDFDSHSGWVRNLWIFQHTRISVTR